MVKADGLGLYEGTLPVLPGKNSANTEILISQYNKSPEETEPGPSEYDAEV